MDLVFPIGLANGSGGQSIPAIATLHRNRVRLYIPRALVNRLGLRIERATAICITPAVREDVDMALNCNVTLFGRSETMRAVVDDDGDICTVGGFILMALDLVVDPITGLPTPRDPNEFVIDI